MPSLSIIVPVFNVEKYLVKCLDSIHGQTFADFEAILIDDGSIDRSGIICDEYASKDKRFKVIHQDNKGVSVSRNKGLEIAHGKYIAYIDADDWIESTMLEKMIEIAEHKKTDIVICGLNYYAEDEKYIRSVSYQERNWDQKSLLYDLFGTPSKVTGSCCNKLFLRKTIETVRFEPALSMAEDILYLVKCFENIKSGYQVSECYYNVLERGSSATRRNSIESMYNTVVQGKKAMMEYAMKHSRELGRYAVIKYFDDCIRFSNTIRTEGNKNNKSYYLKFLLLRLEVVCRLPYYWMTGWVTNQTFRRFLIESML